MIKPPLNGNYVDSGTWNITDENTWSEFNDKSSIYSDYVSQGVWEDSDGYNGWWFYLDEDISYYGKDFIGSSAIVIDANQNNVYDENDYVIGTAYSLDDGGSSGIWERDPNSPYGSYEGGAFGLFEITVKINYVGNNKSDKVLGSSKNDIFKTKGGEDYIFAGKGNDTINGGSGNDKLIGGSGNDTAVFSSKSNVVYLSTTKKQNTKDGLDTLIGIENVNAGSGNDKIYGNKGSNILNGGIGNDTINGGSGNDKLIGGSGNDTAVFSSKSNVVKLFTTKKQNTKDGKDTLIGIENVNAGSGNDKIYGSKGSNILNGGKGNDFLVGGLGNDKLIGGKGKDIFKLSKGKGYDLIQDFKNKQDKIFIGTMKKLKLKNKGKDVLIYSGKDLLAKVKKAKGLLSKKGKYLV